MYAEFITDVDILLTELDERLKNPYKYAYLAKEILTGKAIGKAGTPKPAETNSEKRALLLCQDNTFKNTIYRIEKVMLQITNGSYVPKFLPATEQVPLAYNPDEAEVILKSLLVTLINLLKSELCQELPRLQNIFKNEKILRLYTFILSVPINISNAPEIKISDQKLRHLCYMFGRCGTQNLEEYIRLCMYGGSLSRDYIFDYSSIPYTELRVIPEQDRLYQSQNIGQISQDVIERGYGIISEDEFTAIQPILHSNEFSSLLNKSHSNPSEQLQLLNTFMEQINEDYPRLYEILSILKRTFIEQDIMFMQGYDSYLYPLYFDTTLDMDIKQRIYSYIIRDKAIHIPDEGANTFRELCSKLFLELAKSNDINISNYGDMYLAYYKENIYRTMFSIIGKNPPSSNSKHPLFQKMMLFLFDLYTRTNSIFNIYLFTAIVKFINLHDIIDSLSSFNILDWLFTKQVAFSQEIIGDNIEEYNSVLFMKGSPFQSVVSMAMNMMLNYLPCTLVNIVIPKTASSIKTYEQEIQKEDKSKRDADPMAIEQRYNDNIIKANRSMKSILANNYTLFNDVFTVHTILESMIVNLQERLQNPLKIGLFSKECRVKGVIGVKGTPRPCASPEEYGKLSECQNSIRKSLQQLMTAKTELNFHNVKPVIENIQTHMIAIRGFLNAIQMSESCQSFERLKTFSKNTSTSYEGDIALLNHYIDAILAFPSMNGIIDSILNVAPSQGGFRKTHKKIRTLHKRRNANKKTVKRRKTTRKRLQRHRNRRSMRR